MRSILFVSFLLASSSVWAADAVTDVDPVGDLPPETADAGRFSLLVGAGVGFAPVYEGSDEYRAVYFPIIAPSFGATEGKRRFEFRGLDDVRIHALYLDRLSVGPLLGYSFGRDDDDAARLRGLGDIDSGFVAGGFVNYDFVDTADARIGVDVSFAAQVTGDDFGRSGFGATRFRTDTDYGSEIGAALSADVQATNRLRLAGRAGVNFASDDYMRTHFGVSRAQSVNSGLAGVGLPAFDADGGLKDVYVQAGATYALTERFELRATLGYSRLVGDAADSPVTADRDQFQGTLGAAYRFRF